MADKRPALGKGLSALIPDAPDPPRQAAVDVDLDLLTPNRYQPRLSMNDAALDDLARSIKANGVIQPIVVRRAGERYQIIAGERRWRAAQRAGLMQVPVIVRDVPDDKLLEVALIENIQREDLNPIDEAKAYRRLTDEFSLSQDQIAHEVGKDRSSIANTLRLLKLPQEVQDEILGGALSMGHARALLSLVDDQAQRRVARDVIARGLSVRETEAFVRRELTSAETGAPTDAGERPAKKKDPNERAAEEAMHRALGTPVRIARKGKGGRIEIAFSSEDELQRLYEFITDDIR